LGNLLTMKSVIGLHIDTSSVNGAQIANQKGQAVILRTAAEEIRSQDRLDMDPAISAAIKAVLSKFSLGQTFLACTFHDPQVFVRKITTPPMPAQELKLAVQLAVKNAFPFSLEDAVLDYKLVNKFSQQGKERYNILVAVAPRKTIDHIQSLLANAKVKLASCIPAAIALENLIIRSKMKGDETLAVIILGANVTELAVYQHLHLEFSRKLSISAEDITRSMTGSFFSDTGKTDLTFPEAQQIQKMFGIPKADEQIKVNEKINSQQILMLIGSKIEQLATEISRSLDYYREELQGGKVDRVLLVGQVTLIKRLDEFLSEQLGLEVKSGNLLLGMGIDDTKGHQVLAIGAALDGAQGINLLTKGKRKPPRKTDPNILKGVVIAIMVVILGAYLYLGNQINAKSEEIGVKTQKFTSRLSEASDIRLLKESRPSWKNILKALSYMPDAITLDELNYSENQLHIKGEIIEEDTDPKANLALFISGLQADSLKDARLKSLKKVKDDSEKLTFEIITGIEEVKE